MNKLCLLILPVILVFSGACYAGSYDIKLDLKKGSSYSFDQVSEMKMTQTIMGQDMDINMAFSAKMSFYVKEKEGDIYVTDAKYTSIRMVTKNMYMSMDINTDMNDEPADKVSAMMHKAMKKIVNKPFIVKFNSTGEIREISGIESILRNAMKDVINSAGSGDMLSESDLYNQLNQSYGEEAFKGSFEMYFKIYPGKKVALNDNWSKKISMKSTITGTYDVDYKLTDVTADMYVIGGKGKFSSVSDDYVETNGIEVKYNLTGDYEATLQIDKGSGWIKSGKLKQNFGGNMEMKGNDQMPDGMNMPMQVAVETTLK